MGEGGVFRFSGEGEGGSLQSDYRCPAEKGDLPSCALTAQNMLEHYPTEIVPLHLFRLRLRSYSTLSPMFQFLYGWIMSIQACRDGERRTRYDMHPSA